MLPIDEVTEAFYNQVLQVILKTKFPFLIGGTYAVAFYTGIRRETKDLDIFCKAGDYIKILSAAKEAGLKTEVTDARWIAKIYSGKFHVDLIFGTAAGTWHVDDNWFKNIQTTQLFGIKVKITPPEELIWSKVYYQDRRHYDGADVNHMILKLGNKLDWKRILSHMEPHWEILLAQIINYRFVYPSERHQIPKWLINELLIRLQAQINTPEPKQKVSLGRILSRTQYEIDTKEWGFQFSSNPD